jgi:hypothetical protein
MHGGHRGHGAHSGGHDDPAMHDQDDHAGGSR